MGLFTLIIPLYVSVRMLFLLKTKHKSDLKAIYSQNILK